MFKKIYLKHQGIPEGKGIMLSCPKWKVHCQWYLPKVDIDFRRGKLSSNENILYLLKKQPGRRENSQIKCPRKVWTLKRGKKKWFLYY